jgi:hypothetical protein
VRRGHRLLLALTPVVLVLLVAVSPAVRAQDAAGRVARADSAAVRDVGPPFAGLAAGVAERVPVPSVWPMQGSTDAMTALAALSWTVLVLTAVLALGPVGLTRRGRAPPLGLLVQA